jgi:hypothetical protein
MARYYVCGMVGSGTMLDAFRPEIADEAGVTAWAANQEAPEQPSFVVTLADPDGSLHAALAYDAASNPLGYDWIEVADDGAVTLHAV